MKILQRNGQQVGIRYVRGHELGSCLTPLVVLPFVLLRGEMRMSVRNLYCESAERTIIKSVQSDFVRVKIVDAFTSHSKAKSRFQGL